MGKIKKVYIVAGILLLAGIGLLVNASRDMSTYSTFKEAANTEISVKIVGQLSKDKEIRSVINHFRPTFQASLLFAAFKFVGLKSSMKTEAYTSTGSR